MESKLYYEVHVTIEPVEQDKYVLFEKLAAAQGFWCSEWALKKENGYNFFATTRSKSYDGAYSRMYHLITSLAVRGFKVLRYKIEDTVLDSKIEDILGIVKDSHPLVEDFDRVPS